MHLELALSLSYRPHILISCSLLPRITDICSIVHTSVKCKMSSETQSSGPSGKQAYTLTPCFPFKEL